MTTLAVSFVKSVRKWNDLIDVMPMNHLSQHYISAILLNRRVADSLIYKGGNLGGDSGGPSPQLLGYSYLYPPNNSWDQWGRCSHGRLSQADSVHRSMFVVWHKVFCSSVSPETQFFWGGPKKFFDTSRRFCNPNIDCRFPPFLIYSEILWSANVTVLSYNYQKNCYLYFCGCVFEPLHVLLNSLNILVSRVHQQ